MRFRRDVGLLLALLAGACAAPLEDPARFTGELGCPEGVNVETEVLAVQCAGGICHSPGDDPGGGLDLVSQGAIERVAGIKSPNCSGEVLAVPGDPDVSLIMRKLSAEPPCGERMPLGREIDPESAACISEWIETMAPVGESVGE